MCGRIGSFVGLTGRDSFGDKVTGRGGSGFADDWLAACSRMASLFNATILSLTLLVLDDSAFFKAGFGKH